MSEHVRNLAITIVFKTFGLFEIYAEKIEADLSQLIEDIEA